MLARVVVRLVTMSAGGALWYVDSVTMKLGALTGIGHAIMALSLISLVVVITIGDSV